MTQIIVPPAVDEVSRTRFKVSSLETLLNTMQPTQATAGASSGLANHNTSRKLKVLSHNTGSSANLPAKCLFISRHLTHCVKATFCPPCFILKLRLAMFWSTSVLAKEQKSLSTSEFGVSHRLNLVSWAQGRRRN